MDYHGVESPSMGDPQWSILYWGSKWNLNTVCLYAVGCEWGTTSVYFGITCVCFIPSRLPVLAVEPQYQHQDFLFLLELSFERHIQNLQKNSCWFKIWMVFAGPMLRKLGNSSIWSFLYLPVWCPLVSYLCKHAGDHSVTTEVCSSPHLTSRVWVCVVWRSTLWDPSHQSHNARFCNRNTHICIFLLQIGKLWDMGQEHCGIRAIVNWYM